jgi:hypothetical protein
MFNGRIEIEIVQSDADTAQDDKQEGTTEDLDTLREAINDAKLGDAEEDDLVALYDSD